MKCLIIQYHQYKTEKVTFYYLVIIVYYYDVNQDLSAL